MLTAEKKKKLNDDLWIIAIISIIILVIYSVFNSSINEFVSNSSVNIVLRVLFVGGLFQFGLAGLGIIVVIVFRKESFLDYGLTWKNILPALLLSAACCIPDFFYNYYAGNMHTWLPFSDVSTTAEVLRAGFPNNVME